MRTPLWNVPHHAFALFSSSASLQFEEEGDEGESADLLGTEEPMPTAAVTLGSAHHGHFWRFFNRLASSLDWH